MTEAVESGRGHWSTAIGLTVAVLFLSILDGLTLVLLPLAILLVGEPSGRKRAWVYGGGALWILALVLPAGPLATLSRGWGLVLGALFLSITLFRRDWSVLTRSLVATGSSLALALVALVTSGTAGRLDAALREHFTAATEAFLAMQSRMPESAQLPDLEATARMMTEMRMSVFPSLLALQSLAALALAAWWIRRMGRSDADAYVLGRMRDFRFNDQLIWLLIAGLVLLILPLGAGVERLSVNLLAFMGALYVLRGLAVFAYLASGTKSIATMVFGVLVLILLYPIAFTAALFMGVGDTWLDVRGRLAGQAPG